jgi:hypothetical protein
MFRSIINGMGGAAYGQVRVSARLHRRCCSDLPDDGGPVRDGVAADDWIRREPALPDRLGLGCAGFQHTLPSPEERRHEHSASGVTGPAASFDRQHWDQGLAGR